jgi:integrase
LERFLSLNRRGRWGDWEGPLSISTQTTELAGLRRFYRWVRAESPASRRPNRGNPAAAAGALRPRAGAERRGGGPAAGRDSGRVSGRPKYIGEQLRQAAELAGIPLERPLHTLRHSYARALRRVEAPLEAVQAALDHSNLATTSIYLRQLEGQEDPWWPKLAAELGLQGEVGEEATPAAEERR